ncbi:hypothetical protein HZ994_01995 [Akkermansiaceae bacterium]|nr:hypothetical protein HZ994_01995 [Akkermansiaceae bacterium]
MVEIGQYFPGGLDIFISSASFEGRSLSVINNLDLKKIKLGLLACNVNNDYNLENLNSVLARYEESGSSCLPIATDSNDPIKTTDAFVQEFRNLESHAQRSVAIDITAFTRESLSILLRVIFAYLGENTPITYLYNPASGYGRDEKHWLSRGVSKVRSVIGYSGYIIPSRSNHLILLPGYEFERSAEIIANYEPNCLSLGIVPEEESFTQDFYTKQREFVEKVISYYSHGIVETFKFSAREIQSTKLAVLEVAKSRVDCNTIVIPMNSKPSVIGTSLACLSNRKIQMGYAKPVRYNIEDYSTPSENLVITEIVGH